MLIISHSCTSKFNRNYISKLNIKWVNSLTDDFAISISFASLQSRYFGSDVWCATYQSAKKCRGF